VGRIVANSATASGNILGSDFMSERSSEFVERLTRAEDISPALRASYRAEMESMLEPKMTARRAVPGAVMLVALVVGTVLIVRNMFVYEVKPLVLASWVVLVAAFAATAYLIGRDLWRGKHSPKAAFSIGHIFTFAAGTMTVASLLIGLMEPTKPASMFNAFFLFVFYFACAEWRLQNRIAAAELAAREQMLRIECRLADLMERVGKK
jgi:hypothetical protein